jgi:outer membrane protein assembly factor BamD (BamD/ComL family)
MVLTWLMIGMLGGAATLALAQRVPQRQSSLASVAAAKADKKAANQHGPWFAREVWLIAQCKKELYQGNSVRAMEVLDRYAQEFPLGELVPQALLLRVEVMRARGERTRALAIANQFVANNPKSPYAGPMRRFIGEARPR